MKCENCGKELKNLLIIEKINIKPELFKGKAFCDDACIVEYARKKLSSSELGGVFEYEASEEKT